MAGRSRALKVLSRRADLKFRPDAASPPKRDQAGAHGCSGLTSAARARCETGKPPLCPSSQPRILPVYSDPNGRISPGVAPRWRSPSPILDPQQPSAALCAPQSPNPDAGHLSQISICGAAAGRAKRGMSELPCRRLGSAPPRARSRAAGGRLRLTNWAPRPPLHAVSARLGGEAGSVA